PYVSSTTVSVVAENNDAGTDLGPRVTQPGAAWTAGAYAPSVSTASFSRNATPDGPYDALQLGVKVVDTDGPVLNGLDMNAGTTGTCSPSCTAASIGSSTKVRFGRLRVLPATGPATMALPVPIRTEYWNGTGFATNNLDGCTSFASAGNVSF